MSTPDTDEEYFYVECTENHHCSEWPEYHCCWCGDIIETSLNGYPVPIMMTPLIKKARAWANKYHAGQMYNEYPYIVHLWDVACVAMRFHFNEIIIVACLLHDILEDTSVTYDELVREFGVEVADAVLSVTKDKTLPNRKTKNVEVNLRTAKTLTGIAVKLCDRIANCESGEKNDMYRKEQPEFKATLQREKHSGAVLLQPLWDHLDELLGLSPKRHFEYTAR